MSGTTDGQILHVLQHALGRDQYGKSRRGQEDYRNHFCAGDGHVDFPACREAVARGLMLEHAPRAISGGDYIFTVTEKGNAYVAANSPSPPKITRGQRRYRAYIESDCDLSVGEWLRSHGSAR